MLEDSEMSLKKIQNSALWNDALNHLSCLPGHVQGLKSQYEIKTY